MSFLWAVLLIAFIIFESATTQFICIWFAGGALAALIVSLFSLNLWLQITVFVIVSAIFLIFTRKIVKKLKSNISKTNSDALIGEEALVTQTISNKTSEGEAKIQGKIWSARSLDGKDISAGSLVTVEQISGVKLIVKNKEEE